MQKLLIGIVVLIVSLFLVGVGFLYQKPNYKKLNPVMTYVIKSVYDKWNAKLETIPKDEWQIVEYDTLMSSLNYFEEYLVGRIFEIPPLELGFKGQKVNTKRPNNLVKIPPRTLHTAKGTLGIPARYCPKHSYDDFERMMAHMKRDLGKRLFINSGYRSPGRQAYGFIDDLVMPRNNFSLLKASKWVAMPGYSEHNSGKFNAIDLINEKGISGEEKGQNANHFAKTDEYRWMLMHAAKYNFSLSYPRGNDKGVQFEPWHWRWVKH